LINTNKHIKTKEGIERKGTKEGIEKGQECEWPRFKNGLDLFVCCLTTQKRAPAVWERSV